MPAHLSARRIAIFGLCLCLFALGASGASAGTLFNLYVTNNTNTNFVVGAAAQQKNWYPKSIIGASIPTGRTTALLSEECSFFIGCATSSYIQFPIQTKTGPTTSVANIYLKGWEGDFPSWPDAYQFWADNTGGVMVDSLVSTNNTALVSKLDCDPEANNTITCRITIDPATFSTTNPKYGTTDPVLNARSYFTPSRTLMTDAVVFDADAMAKNQVAQQSDGVVRYVNPSAAASQLKQQSCAGAETPSILYVVTTDWSMYAMSVCDDREIPILPLTYSSAALSGGANAGGVEAVDIARPFTTTIQNGYIALTHGGLAGAATVRSAGELTVRGGKISSINNGSGHYSASAAALKEVVKYFRRAGWGGAFLNKDCTTTTGGVCTFGTP